MRESFWKKFPTFYETLITFSDFRHSKTSSIESGIKHFTRVIDDFPVQLILKMAQICGPTGPTTPSMGAHKFLGEELSELGELCCVGS
jgi:hypothetical protein